MSRSPRRTCACATSRSSPPAPTAQGDGGTIDMTVAQSVRLIGRSEVTAEAQGTGGNITIDPVTVVLDASQVTANAVNGNGGNILIRTSAFVPSSDPRTRVTASS